MAFCNHSFKFLWRTVNSKPPSMPYRIVACTFCHSLSRNSCIQQSWPYVWSIMTAYLLLNAPHVRESEFWNVSFQKISIPPQRMDNGIFWRGDNTIGEIFDSGIRNPELFLLLESGRSRNPEATNDWDPGFKLYWQRVESNIWNPESTVGFPYKGQFHAWFSLTEHTYLLCIQVFRIHLDRRFDRYCVK